MAQRTQVPQEAVDALQRGDLLAAFKTIRQQGGGVNLQAIGNVLETHARQYAQQQAAGKPQVQAAAVKARQVVGSATDAAEASRQQAAEAMRTLMQRKQAPTVAMGDAPGSLRWVLLVLALLAAAVVLVFGGG